MASPSIDAGCQPIELIVAQHIDRPVGGNGERVAQLRSVHETKRGIVHGRLRQRVGTGIVRVDRT